MADWRSGASSGHGPNQAMGLVRALLGSGSGMGDEMAREQASGERAGAL